MLVPGSGAKMKTDSSEKRDHRKDEVGNTSRTVWHSYSSGGSLSSNGWISFDHFDWLGWCAVAPNVATVVQLSTLQSGGTSCGASETVRSNKAIAICETAADISCWMKVCICTFGQDFLSQLSLICKWWSALSLLAALAFESLKVKV